jgi:hypothetical protein
LAVPPGSRAAGRVAVAFICGSSQLLAYAR